MATIRFYTDFDMRFFSNSGTEFHDSISAGTLSANSDLYRITESLGRDDFYGNGLSGSDHHMPTDGAVTEWAYSVSEGFGSYSLAWDFYDFSTNAEVFSSYVLADDVDTLMSAFVMVGGDNVYGSEGNDGLLGYANNDIIVGNGGDDYIDGGVGIDDMVGGSGNDTFVLNTIDDLVEEHAGEGIDTEIIRFDSFQTWAMANFVENARNTGSFGAQMIGNALNNRITGTDAATDALYGGAGDDILVGGTSDGDAMYGGLGDDIFIVDSTNDYVTDYTDTRDTSPQGGFDEVRSTVTFSLAGAARVDIDDVRLLGTVAINATGNALDNILTGNGANNVLNGAAGADLMRGGNGNDTYAVDNVGDRVIEASPDGGIDKVNSSVSFTLGANVENLTLTGSALTNGRGNALANTISGNSANNSLHGMDGDDALNGGGGNDQIYGELGTDRLTGRAGADRFVFDTALGGTNHDNITDFTVADDSIVLDRTIFTAFTTNGTLASGNFFTGTAAHDGNDQIIYNSATGNIYYDADGNGAGAQVLVAHVAAGLVLTNADFLIVS